jgi:hypothetical protein
MSGRILASLILAAWSVAAFGAPALGADRSQHVALIGCIAEVPDGGLQLTNAMRASAARTGGSNSAKASTPVGGAGATADGQRTPGPGTAKGSVPVSVVPASLTLPPSGGANTPKASTPVAHEPTIYAFDAGHSDVAPYVGRTVQVVGLLERGVVTAQTIRLLADACGR